MNRYLQLYLDSYRGISQPAWMLAIIMLINRMGAMVLPFLGIYMTDALHFSLSETGVVLSCFGIGAMTGSALGGWLTDLKGHFKVQLFSLLLSIPIFFLLTLLKTPTTLAIGVFVLSVITETFRPANSVSITSYAKPENITRAFSLNRMALNLGFSIGPAIGGLLAAISYQWLFYGNGLTALLAGMVFYLYFRNRQGNKLRESKNPEPKTKIIKTGISPWKDQKFLIFSLLCCLYSICFFQLLSTLPLFYREVHHLSEANIGLLLAFNGMVVFVLEMLLVQIAEKKMRSAHIISLGTVLLGLSFLLLLFLNAGQWILFLAMFLLSISEMLAMPFMATLTIKRASKERQGAYMGLNALSFSAAHVVSPLIGTGIAQYFGFSALWVSTALLAIVTALGLRWILKKF